MGQDIARLAELAVGLFAYFAEDGTQTDDTTPLTISSTVLPDSDPTTNWKSLGAVLPGATPSVEEIDDPYMELVGDKYVKRERKTVVGDYLTFETRQMNHLVESMMHGIASGFSEDTDIAPYTKIDRNVKGWLLLQARKLGAGGADDHRKVCWVELRLPTIPKAADTMVMKPGILAQFLPNDLNSIRFIA